MERERFAVQRLQPFVRAAHARAAPARKNEPGDART
jgi:hypothetical protein